MRQKLCSYSDCYSRRCSGTTIHKSFKKECILIIGAIKLANTIFFFSCTISNCIVSQSAKIETGCQLSNCIIGDNQTIATMCKAYSVCVFSLSFIWSNKTVSFLHISFELKYLLYFKHCSSFLSEISDF